MGLSRSLANRYAVLAVCAGLLLMVFAAFGQAVRFDFISLDDDVHIYENVMVNHGVTAKGVVWAFTKSNEGNWHPATSISHMLVCQFFGLNPGWHHLTNILLHAGGTILLFLVLRKMTGQFWPSAFVAALFALHPLRVESVVWITERKDVLSGVFFMLTLGAYVRYVRRPFSFARYGLVAVFLTLGLMSKAMIVTTPCVLLLLDYWPLRRTDSITRCVLEKLPLLAISVAASVLTFLIQGNVIDVNKDYPLSWRIGNAVITYVTYLGHFFYPVNFAVVYPRLGVPLPLWQVFGAAAILIGITAAVVVAYKKYPYLLVGWLWYLGMLLPVIGLIQVGKTAVADRFTYLPQIGIGIMLTWGAADLLHSWPQCRRVYGIASAMILSVLIVLTWYAASFWHDDETLWTHTLACTSKNWLAHDQLGIVLTGRGQIDEAITHYQKALETKPDDVVAHNNLALVLASRGQIDAAVSHYEKVLEINPDFAESHNNLGATLASRGQIDAAISHYEKALEIKPDCVAAHVNLGAALAGRGQIDAAIDHFQKAIEIKPNDVGARRDLEVVLSERKRILTALAAQRELLRSRPKDTTLLNNIAWMLATNPNASVRNGAEAVDLAQRAVELSDGKSPEILATLAAAYAEAGRFAEAVQTASKALDLAIQQKKQPLANSIEVRIRLYEAKTPFHESQASPAKTSIRP